MKIGSVVFATEQGLGILAKDLYDHGVIHRVMIQPHSRHREFHSWYGSNGRPLHRDNYDWFFEGLDAVIFLETPFDWSLIVEARKRGIVTMLMPDECTPYPLHYEPDIILCPSALERTYNEGKYCLDVVFPPTVEWHLRSKAHIFIHNAGHGGLGGRNGTRELIEAMQYVKSPIKLIIRSQTHEFSSNDPRVEIRHGTVPHEQLWAQGDVFVFPDKFAGLSMPMQEAFAAGMLVMTSNRYPNNVWLPTAPLIPVSGYKMEQLGIKFQSAIITPQDIATTMDFWYGENIELYSSLGFAWSKTHTWGKLKKVISLALKDKR